MKLATEPYYVPQIFGQFNKQTVGQILKVETKLNALNEILEGKTTEQNLHTLGEDWDIEERCRKVLHYWKLDSLDLSQPLGDLSGGQKTRVFMAGISIHRPALVLLDEPSNHLDLAGRELLYNFIHKTNCAFLVVSHDRKLLDYLNLIYELTRNGITRYGGNYSFYELQKQTQNNSLVESIEDKEKSLRKAKAIERETIARQERLNSRGKSKQEKAGVARIMMNTLRNNAERSTAKIKSVHTDKLDNVRQDLQDLKAELPAVDKIKFDFDNSGLHFGKILVTVREINAAYDQNLMWTENLNFQIKAGERITIKGANGSGSVNDIFCKLSIISFDNS